MKSSLLLLFLTLAPLSWTSRSHADTVKITAGMILQQSCKVAAGTYSLANEDSSGASAAVYVRGDNITVDFENSILEGTLQTTTPDHRAGTGLKVAGKNITIKNLRVRGYKVGLVAFDSPGLRLINCDLSYNWKQHLASGLDREDESDWMSYHQNEKDEWLEYGAGAYLRRCDGFEAKSVVVRGGQCGLMLMECNHGLVWNCDFSFLSGIGLGLYESSNNRIMHNRIDWCVRGYSHGVYNRGQDSAGILIYEQSNHNLFAFNSVTHGGDGFFLWAGQTTMNTGTGGCNDNVVYGNDFSHAPTNGIEATFSRNRFINNLVMECWHGVWGGYSYDTVIDDNLFAYNAESIAIEHGQNNSIRGNLFYREGMAINLWQKEKQDPSWGYGKYHDTVSHGYRIADNTFSQVSQAHTSGSKAPPSGLVYSIRATSDVHIGENRYGPRAATLDLRGPLTEFNMNGSTDSSKKNEGFKTVALAQLGTGWDQQHQGSFALGGAISGILPGVMRSDGNVAIPYPEGEEAYVKRFRTDWNPLSDDKIGHVTVGDLREGHALTLTPVPNDPLPTPLAGGISPFLTRTALRGRAYILVDEWGPYDFQRPILWPRKKPGTSDSTDTGDERFEILGPKGKWHVTSIEGGSLSSTNGDVPGFVSFKRAATSGGKVKIVLAYNGARTVDYRGIAAPAGATVPFQYSEFSLPIHWDIKLFKYDKATQEPRTQTEAFRNLIDHTTPVASIKASELNLAPGRIPASVGNDYFATVADGEFEIEPGDYLIDSTLDDGGRVWLDGKLLVDEWKYEGPTLYTREVHLAGKHHLHVEHFQIDGYWMLKVSIRQKP